MEAGRGGVLSLWFCALVLMVAISTMSMMGGVSAAAKPKKGQKGWLDPASTNYLVLDPNPKTGQERFFCLARGRCRYKTIQCPKQCNLRKPQIGRSVKACFADCSSSCETTCKNRIPNCNGYGSVCYDPRFVGGDGVMFYFHGAKGGDFALVSDDQFQINVHFIGIRPEGRTRDFTWVQALALMFDSHTLVIAAKKIAKWDDSFDALIIRWDGKEVIVPIDGEAEWRTTTTTTTTNEGDEDQLALPREVVVERTAATNSARVTVSGIVEMNLKVVPITEEDDRAHGYHIPAGDAFAHLETQFKFANLTNHVEGILGQTYRPGYVSPVKKGVAMPMIGGEDRYRTLSFLSTGCGSCRFHHPARVVDESANMMDLAQY